MRFWQRVAHMHGLFKCRLLRSFDENLKVNYEKSLYTSEFIDCRTANECRSVGTNHS